jgi:ERCC4-type nuclease
VSKPAPFRICIDTREPPRTAWRFPGFEVVRMKLNEGDYAPEPLVGRVAIERKEINDMTACCGRERARFEAELDRLASYYIAHVVIEADITTVVRHGYVSRIAPESVLGSIEAWAHKHRHIHFHWMGSRAIAERRALSLLVKAHRYLTEEKHGDEREAG